MTTRLPASPASVLVLAKGTRSQPEPYLTKTPPAATCRVPAIVLHGFLSTDLQNDMDTKILAKGSLMAKRSIWLLDSELGPCCHRLAPSYVVEYQTIGGQTKKDQPEMESNT